MKIIKKLANQGFIGFLLSLAGSQITCSMEMLKSTNNVPEKQIKKDSESKKAAKKRERSLASVYAHITTYRPEIKNNTTKISGFHHHQSDDVAFYKEGFLIKHDDKLWIYTQTKNLNDYHVGYIIHNGKLCEKVKSFFPCSLNYNRLNHLLKEILQKAEKLKINKQALEVPLSIDGVERLFKVVPNEDGTRIKTIYPKKQKRKKNISPQISGILKELEIQQQALNQAMAKQAESINHDRIIEALKGNDIPLIKTFFAKGIDKSRLDKESNTLLHYASQKGCHSIVNKFIREDIVDIENNDHKTPLMIAIESENIAAVRCLLEHKADPNKVTKLEKTPLMHVIQTFTDEEKACQIIELLLQYKADINFTNSQEDTALKAAIKRDNVSVLRTVLDEPTLEIDKLNAQKITPLAYAFQCNNNNCGAIAIQLLKRKVLLKTSKSLISGKIHPKSKVKIEKLLKDNEPDLYRSEGADTHFYHKSTAKNTQLEEPNLDITPGAVIAVITASRLKENQELLADQEKNDANCKEKLEALMMVMEKGKKIETILPSNETLVNASKKDVNKLMFGVSRNAADKLASTKKHFPNYGDKR